MKVAKMVAAAVLTMASVGVANAAWVGHIDTTDGGQVVFSNMPCSTMADGQYPAIDPWLRSTGGFGFTQYDRGGSVNAFGCYNIQAGVVSLKFYGGDERSIALDRVQH